MTFKKGQKVPGANIFQKGVSGNPNGRPKKLPNLEKILAAVLGQEDKDGITEAQHIIAKLKDQAKNGNVRASEIVLDRGWGKPKQIIESQNTNINAEMSNEQLNDKIAQLMANAGKDEQDDAEAGE